MSNLCIRCQKDVGKTIHIFRGGECRRKLTELTTGKQVTLCDQLVPDSEPDIYYYDDAQNKWIGEKEFTNAEIEAEAKHILESLSEYKSM